MSRRSPSLEEWDPMEEDFENTGFNSYRGRTCLDATDISLAAQGGKTKRHYDHQLVQLHVNKIPVEMDEKGLCHLFSKCGRVLGAKILYPKGIQGPKYVFGKVEYESVSDALAAIQMYHLRPPLNLDVQLDRQCFINGEIPAAFRSCYNNYGGANGPNRRALLATPSNHYDSHNPGSRMNNGRLNQLFGSTHSSALKLRNSQLPLTVTSGPYERKVKVTHEDVGSHGNFQSSFRDRPLNSRTGDMDSRRSAQRDAEEEEKCIKCKRIGKFRCVTCKAVYCSVDCQRGDWARHKFICLPVDKQGAAQSNTPNDVAKREALPAASASRSGTGLLKTPEKPGGMGQSKKPSEPHRSYPKHNQSPNQKNDHAGGREHSTNERRPRSAQSVERQKHEPPNRGHNQERPHSSSSKSDKSNSGCSEKGIESQRTSPHPAYKKEAAGKEKKDAKTEPRKDAEAEPRKEAKAEPIKDVEAEPRKDATGEQKQATPSPCKEQNGRSRSASRDVEEKQTPAVKEEVVVKDPIIMERVTPPRAKTPATTASVPEVCKTPQLKRTLLADEGLTQVVVTHIATPHSFYLQLVHNQGLAAIMRKVQSVESTSPPEKVSIGQLVAAKYSEDNIWYRAQVETIDGNNLTVKYIDYGNVEPVTLENVRPLGPEISDLPIQCIWCRLAHVEPVQGKWDHEALESFRVFVTDVPLYASVARKPYGNQQCITLVDKKTNGNDVGDLMIFTNLATRSHSIHYNAVGFWTKGSEVTVHFPTLEKVGLVWAMDKSSITEDILADILGSLAVECEPLENGDTTSITIGTLVAAKSPVDSGWYRGVVLNPTETGGWLVRYLDFGNSEEVSVLHPLPEKYLEHISLSVCFEVDEPYSIECLPDELSQDDTLIVTVREVNGDVAEVDVRLGDGDSVFPALVSSIWKASFVDDPCAVEPQVEDVETIVPALPATVKNVQASPTCASVSATAALSPQTSEHSSNVKLPSAEAASVPVLAVPGAFIPAENVDVYPVFVEALNKIHVQVLTVEIVDQLKNLQAELNKEENKGSFAKLDRLPSVGQVVCAMYSTDESWCRCQVESVHSAEDIRVRFIDFGNMESSSLENLRDLPGRFYESARLSLIVTPRDLHPHFTLENVRNLLTPEDYPSSWQMKVVDRASMPVEVVFTLDGKTLEQLLGERSETSIVKPEPEAVPLSTIEEAIQEAVPELGPSPPKPSAKDVDVSPNFKTASDNAVTAHVEKNTSKEELFPKITYGSMASVELPLGETVEVIVTDVQSPELIFCCMFNPGEIEKYDLMAQEMTDYANEIGIPNGYAPETNEMCLAKSSTYDQFYRAMVFECGKSETSVLFVDYGSTESVNNQDFRPIRKQYLKLPLQAIQCIMHGLKKTLAYSEERCKEFKDIVKVNEVYKLEVVSKAADGCYFFIRIPSVESDLKKAGFLAPQ